MLVAFSSRRLLLAPYTSSHKWASPEYSERTNPTRLFVSDRFLTCFRSAHEHLFILAYPYAFPLDDLQVLQPAQDIMLNLEVGLHAELGTFLDGEGLRLQRLESAGSGQIDGDIRATLNLEGQGLNDTAPFV